MGWFSLTVFVVLMCAAMVLVITAGYLRYSNRRETMEVWR